MDSLVSQQEFLQGFQGFQGHISKFFEKQKPGLRVTLIRFDPKVGWQALIEREYQACAVL